MLTRSISRTDAAPMPKHTARSRILTDKALTLGGGELLGVVHAGDGAHVGRHDDGTCDDGARERAPSDFIDSGDQRPDGFAELALDRLPPIPRHGPARSYSADAGFRNGDARLLLANARRLAGEIAQVVELGATDAAAAHHDDLGEHGAVHREDALDADAVGDLADGERRADTAAAARDADAFERLDALLFTFLDADVHAKRVAGAERRNVAQPLFLGFDEGMHMTLGAKGPGRSCFGGDLG